MKGFLMRPNPLTNFEMKRYYQNEPEFNGLCSHDNLQLHSKIKDGAYVINLDEYADTAVIGLLCTQTVIQQHILIVLVSSTFHKKLKNSKATKTLLQIFAEYKLMIQ